MTSRENGGEGEEEKDVGLGAKRFEDESDMVWMGWGGW